VEIPGALRLPGRRNPAPNVSARHSPHQIIRHLELRVIRVVFGGGGVGFGACGLAVVEHDHAGIAFAHLVGGGAGQQRRRVGILPTALAWRVKVGASCGAALTRLRAMRW
jgi:hypothetical protein